MSRPPMVPVMVTILNSYRCRARRGAGPGLKRIKARRPHPARPQVRAFCLWLVLQWLAGVAWAAPRATDEEVAQWAVTVGAFVTTKSGEKTFQTNEATGLPEGRYQLIALGFPSLARVSESDLVRVGQLRHLSYLEFKDATGLTAAGLAGACAGQSLNMLLLRNLPLTDADLAAIGRLKSLRTLDISGAPKLTGTVWREWKGLTLNRLAIAGTGYAPGSLTALADLKSIQSLTLDAIDGLTSAEFSKGVRFPTPDVELANLPALRGDLRVALAAFPRASSLRLTGQTLDPADLEVVAKFKPMTFLQLSSTGTGDDQVASVARASSLATLHWFHFASPGHSLGALATCKPLRQLALSDSQITDAGLRQLATLTQVERLLLDGNPAITDDGIVALAVMKQLRTLRLSRTPVTDAALTPLTALRRLESLELVGCPGVTPEGMAAIQAALPKCRISYP
ncbi:MAG: hypothetical protein ACKV19_25345 [Verrucomicrobiales bacterium]